MGGMRTACLLMLGCLLAACTHSNHPLDLRIREPVRAEGRELSLALYQSTGVALQPGHAVEHIPSPQLPEVLAAEVEQASHSVHVLATTWEPGPGAERLSQALVERPPGVQCRVLVDALGGATFLAGGAERLRKAGCEVRAFRPVQPGTGRREVRLRARNLRQLLIRDGRSAVVGGAGWGAATEAWQDTSVRVEGPAVRQVQQSFGESWMEAGGWLLPPETLQPPEPLGAARAAYMTSTGSPHLSNAERLVRLLAAAAQRRLWLANACFAPEEATADMLWLRAKAGVDVRVLLPAEGLGHCGPGWPPVEGRNYKRLLQRGVRLWAYTQRPLRSRFLLVDDKVVAVGGFNLEARSHEWLEHGALVVEDEALSRSLAQEFEQALAGSLELR